MTLSALPKYDEFEVSVFGPGRGECILVHMGYNEWCMIDSCVGRGRSLPAAVEYLTDLGQAALDGVLLVLATHWHDDHIGGIASCSVRSQMRNLHARRRWGSTSFSPWCNSSGKSLQGDSGVDELEKSLEILRERDSRSQSARATTTVWAVQDRRLLTWIRADAHSLPQ